MNLINHCDSCLNCFYIDLTRCKKCDDVFKACEKSSQSKCSSWATGNNKCCPILQMFSANRTTLIIAKNAVYMTVIAKNMNH